MNHTATAEAAADANIRPFAPARLAISTAVAIILNAAVFLIASAAGASMLIEQPSTTQLNIGAVIAATLVPLTLAGVATWFLARRQPVIRTVAAWTGFGLALASSASPLQVSADVLTGIALGIMHVIAGVAWLVGVKRPTA